MKREEIARMFRYLGRFYADMTEKAMNSEIVNAWQVHLCNVKKEDAWTILQDYIKDNKYSPAVCDIIGPWRQRGFERANHKVGE